MILTDLAEWTTAPGRVLRWRPTEIARTAAGTAPIDPGQASILQTDHLNAYRSLVRDGGTHRAWTGVATTVDEPLDRGALSRALTRLVRTHGGFRTFFDLSGDQPVRHLVPTESVAFECVEDPPLDPAAWDQAFHEHIVAWFDAECRPDSWPGFVLGVVEHDDAFDLFWGCDHAFTDGASQLLLCAEIAELYAAELAEPGGPETVPGGLPDPGETGDFRTYTTLERASAAEYTPDSPAIAEWVRIIADNGRRLPRFPLPLGLAEGERAPAVIRSTTLLDGGEVEAFERSCKRWEAGTTAGVFAAVAETDRALAEHDHYFGVTVLGTRHHGPFARSQGWFCAFAPVEFEVSDVADFGVLARRARDSLARAKKLADAPVDLVLETLVRTGVCPPEALGSPQLLSYLDLRRFPGAGRPAYERGVHFTGLGRTANASLWINRERERLTLVAQVPDTPVAAVSVSRYHDHLREVFRAVVSSETVGAG